MHEGSNAVAVHCGAGCRGRVSRRRADDAERRVRGDQNMVDYVNNYLGPKFEQMNPGVKVRAVGTGPGDSGSQKIYENCRPTEGGHGNVGRRRRRRAPAGAATMVDEKLLMPYRNDVAAGKLVSRDTAKNALGANVDGYVLPMFHSQIAFAYNPDVVKAPPKSFTELSDWVKKNPKQFGYNGVKGGMSGVGFVMGWVNANSGMGDKLEKGPYDPAAKRRSRNRWRG
jgi:ABC-type glycerol-3-phosphate transport system substrate-binding protein